MNSHKMLIFSDLDGTLLDHYTYQATQAIQTLERLKSARIPVILNTSKTLAEIDVIKQELNLTAPAIIENGAAVYIPVGTFKKQPEGTKTNGKYWVKSFCFPRSHWLSFLSENAADYSRDFQGFSTLTPPELSKLTGLTVHEAMRAQERQYGEPINWLGDVNSKNAFIEHLVDKGANVVQGGRFIHVGGHCDKGQAMIWLAEQYRNESVQESILTIALGDGENDSAMLEAADIAVQVRSPVHEFPTLRRQFKTVQTQLYGPEGWADAIQTILSKQLSSTLTNSEV